MADAKLMLGSEHGGGFSVDLSVRVGAQERTRLVRMLLYCVRSLFVGQRLRMRGEQIVYRYLRAPADK
jgi:Putative transposase